MDLNNDQINFWRRFVEDNMLPPMKYKDPIEDVEFKSFNTKFVIWLITHKGFKDIYFYFLREHYQDVMNNFMLKYMLDVKELSQLVYYVKHLPELFMQEDEINNCKIKNEMNEDTQDKSDKGEKKEKEESRKESKESKMSRGTVKRSFEMKSKEDDIFDYLKFDEEMSKKSVIRFDGSFHYEYDGFIIDEL